MNTSIRSIQPMTTYGDPLEERLLGGIKRRREGVSSEANQITDVQEEGPFTSLPTDILMTIIQQTDLIQLQGLLGSSKKFYSLVFTYTDKIIIKKSREVFYLQAMLNEMSKHSCKDLRVVEIKPPDDDKSRHSFNDETLSSLIQLSNLNKLFLGTKVTNLSAESFLRFTALQKLEHFEISYCNVDGSVLKPVLQSLTKLQTLRIRGINMEENDQLISSVATTSLKQLGLWTQEANRPITDSDFPYLSRQTGLQELILGNCRAQTPDSFQSIAQLTGLQHLGLFSQNIPNQELARLTTLTNLTSLHLAGCTDDECASSLTQPKLRYLAIISRPQSRITGMFLKKISHLKLISLRLDKCSLIMDRDLINLWVNLNLGRLALEKLEGLSNTALKVIALHPTLKNLVLVSLPNIDNKGIQSLENMQNLQALEVNQCQKIDTRGIDYLVKNHLNSRLNNLSINYKPYLHVLDE